MWGDVWGMEVWRVCACGYKSAVKKDTVKSSVSVVGVWKSVVEEKDTQRSAGGVLWRCGSVRERGSAVEGKDTVEGQWCGGEGEVEGRCHEDAGEM